MRRFLAKCGAFLGRARMERELQREIASHLALLEDEYLQRGLPPAEARLAARRAYGNVDLAKELQRDERSFPWLEQTILDLRQAARSLSRSPGFALLAILTLALGVGVNTALFSVYDAVALRPLPVADPDRVVRLERWFQNRAVGTIQYLFSYPEYAYCRDHNAGFASMAAGSSNLRVVARIDDQPEKVIGQLVSANYFEALGVGARLGRTFLPVEDRVPGAAPVMVIGHNFWRTRFHSDPEVLGRTVEIFDTTYTIVGVAAEGFNSTAVDDPFTQFWVPLSMQAQLAPPRRWASDAAERHLQIMGRLKPSISRKGAEAEISGLIEQIADHTEERERTTAVTLQRTSLLGNTEDIRFQGVVVGVMLLVGLVLLVACANIANMLLARGATRQREIGLRLALGASRGRVMRHLLAESFALAFCGGLAGLLLAAWSEQLLNRAFAQVLADTQAGAAGFTLDLRMDAAVFGYAFALSLAAGFFFGLAPALQFTRPDLTSALKDEGSGFGRGVTRQGLRNLLVGAQVAVSMLLLITAGLLLRGLARSQNADPGFDSSRVFLLSTESGTARAPEAQARLIDWLKTLPELEGVAVGSYPMMGTWTPPIVVKPSTSPAPVTGRTLASYASETYFETLGVPLFRGRSFTLQEVRQHAPVAVISEATARRFWASEDPIGRRFQLDLDFNGKLADFEVIGIVKDVRFASLSRVDPAHIYLTPRAETAAGLLLRSAGDPRYALKSVRDHIRQFDPNLLPGLWLTSVQDGPMMFERTQARAFALFALILASLASALAGVGIYGVVSYLVNQRVKEFGIRMALGASSGAVLRSVVVHNLRPVLMGIAAGVAGAAGLSALLHATLSFPGTRDVLFGVPFYDPVTFIGLTLFLIAIAGLASAVPARRAMRVDPMIALRYE